MGVQIPSGAQSLRAGTEGRRFKSSQGRMAKKKPIKREFSAGGVVYKKVKEQESRRVKILWLLYKPAGRRKFYQKGWRFPKGWIDEGETSQEAALREVEEEGGVKAEIIDKIDRVQYFFYNEQKEKVLKSIAFYLMKWLADVKNGPGWETEKIEWLPFNEAHQKLAFDSEKKALKRAKKILEEKERQQSLL